MARARQHGGRGKVAPSPAQEEDMGQGQGQGQRLESGAAEQGQRLETEQPNKADRDSHASALHKSAGHPVGEKESPRKERHPGKRSAKEGGDSAKAGDMAKEKGPASKEGTDAAGDSWHRLAGFRLFLQQTWALLVKNYLLALRNRGSTCSQLLSASSFVLLLFAVSLTTDTLSGASSSVTDVRHPQAAPLVRPIPPCTDEPSLRPDCFDFLWTGNTSADIQGLVKNISENNPGRPIDFETRTKGFATPEDVDAWLLENPYRTRCAILFFVLPGDTIGFALQGNFTPDVRGYGYADPTFKYQLPLLGGAEREILRYTTQNWDVAYTPSIAEFAHPKNSWVNLMGSMAAIFLFGAASFNSIAQMSNIVLEKELKLRQAMATMGLMSSAYWTSWLLWEAVMAAISCSLVTGLGFLFRIKFFVMNSVGVCFLLFFLFWLAMTSVAFVTSIFLRKSASANTTAYAIFLFGVAFEVLIVIRFPGLESLEGFPFAQQHPPALRLLLSFFPPCLFALGLKHLGDSALCLHPVPITLTNATSCPASDSLCTRTPADILGWLSGLVFFYFFLAMYLEKVLPDANGMRHHPLFFLGFKLRLRLRPHRGRGVFQRRRHQERAIHPLGAPPEGDAHGSNADNEMCEDVDVVEERKKVQKSMEFEGQSAPDSWHGNSWHEERKRSGVALSVRGLEKEFPGGMAGGLCGMLGKKITPHKAVQGTWFEVPQGTLFCLLGPNGAGKSTTINCLTGVTRASGGDALVYGESILGAHSMSNIRKSMGVCPQFDTLWDQLSGIEHLFLFARIRGLLPQNIPKEVDHLLGEVRLEEAQRVRSESYSGGMRRRLSVAVALIGNPRIVFLDEPTTGMDPVSRRHVWNIIERAKRGRAVVLTTHSMEEADILGDRIAIMAKGRLRCIGTSIHLKQRFGSGIRVRVALHPRRPKQKKLKQRKNEKILRKDGAEVVGEELERRGGVMRIDRSRDIGENGGDKEAVGGTALLEQDRRQSRKAIKAYFNKHMGLKPVEQTQDWVSFCLPSGQGSGEGRSQGQGEREAGGQGVQKRPDHLTPAEFFKNLNRKKEKLGVSHIQLSLTSLEEVFLSIARLAELEAEGRYENLVLPSGTTAKVPVGAELVRIPRLEVEVAKEGSEEGEGPQSAQWLMRVEWEQDEVGRLHMARHSKPFLDKPGSSVTRVVWDEDEHMAMQPALVCGIHCLGSSKKVDYVVATTVQRR